MALFKKPDEYKSELLKPVAPSESASESAAAAPLTIADLDEQPAVPDSPTTDINTDEAWEKLVVVGDFPPSFYDVPKRNEPPHNRYYYAWANASQLNMQLKTGLGWRIVPPSMCRSLGLNEYQIKADAARVMDMILIYIPRKPIDDFVRRKREQEIRNPMDAPAVQQFLDMSSPKRGITTFGGPAEDVAERNKWRLDRPIRTGYTGRSR